MTEKRMIFLGLVGLVLGIHHSAPAAGAAALRLPSFIGEGMVIQQNRDFRLAGEGRPGAEVTVRLEESVSSTRVGENGAWSTAVPVPPAGGPYSLTVTSGAEQLRFEDVLVGEVWLCSGQSNMEWEVQNSDAADSPMNRDVARRIRLFEVPRTTAAEPAEELGGKWTEATMETRSTFSAVAWHFGHAIAAARDVPVGLIQSAWGGTRIEAWMPESSLREFPELDPWLEGDLAMVRDLDPSVYNEMTEQAKEVRFLSDPGNRGLLFGYHLPELEDTDWKKMNLPGTLEDKGLPVDGAFWFRREVSLPAEWSGKELVLELGRIDDFDQTYVNGHKVGGTSKGNPQNAHAVPRSYAISPGLLEQEENTLTIAVRVFDHYGKGGFTGPPSDMRLYPKNGDVASGIPLAGEWKMSMEMEVLDQRNDNDSLLRHLPSNPNRPAVLFNGMIHPLLSFPVRGVLWYQGESNSGAPELYAKLFPEMIRSWRTAWQNQSMPFLYVQLANFKDRQTEPSEGGWARIREAQQAALALPKTAEAVIIDAGEADDIHPRDKKTVGHRLALQARAMVYGEDLPHSSPYYEGHDIRGDEVHLSVRPTYGGLRTSDHGEPVGFAIRGSGGEWRWAEARIKDETTIIVRHPEVETPEAVRYGWADNPVGNVVNEAGLPLSPFRTDR